jgi:hypothetical protein
MGRLINTTSMTIDDGSISVTGSSPRATTTEPHGRSPIARGAAMLVGRTSFEGFAGFWPTQFGPWPTS